MILWLYNEGDEAINSMQLIYEEGEGEIWKMILKYKHHINVYLVS